VGANPSEAQSLKTRSKDGDATNAGIQGRFMHILVGSFAQGEA